MRQETSAFVWDVDLRALNGLRRLLISTLRLGYVLGRELLRGELNLRAMSLVYTTLLSVVPLLAVSFSVLKAFGVHNQVGPVLYNFLEPLGPKGNELATDIIGFVENVEVGVLGTIGLGLLVYTVISLVQKIEGDFNFVWRVDSLRSFGRRFSNYLSVILIGPVLILSAIGITASIMNTALMQRLLTVEPFSTLGVGVGKLVPYLLVWAAFTFIYVFVPNTRVRLVPAAVGGLVGGLLWQSTGWGFAAFIASSAKYAAIYSSFAIMILLLIWLYLNWLILLLGAQIAFFMQKPQYLTRMPVRLELSGRLRERLALTLMFLIGSHHYHHRDAWTLESLVDHLDLPNDPVYRLLTVLKDQGFIAQNDEDPPGYLPARAVETIELRTLLAAVRGAEESRFLSDDRIHVPAPVDRVVQRSQEAVERALGGATLRDLILERSGPAVVPHGRPGRS